jgi:hypothetical protein
VAVAGTMAAAASTVRRTKAPFAIVELTKEKVIVIRE